MSCHRPLCPCRPWRALGLCALCLGTLLGELPGDPADDSTEVYDDAACEPACEPADGAA